ncbi:hypothetical protein CONPUDRAFT_165898 [Coniophora puteana RWD-64-598 SS2]|uniref:F-box domain-containing protein n=1 Tax=Coniophora puteana (strain RWD-64-598) TaxID=741705 RepID=A0A5M3MMN0_CONPW|nr:uncharacterized protein CONPUDRAFT_165898 [Coniophora puteana RWD-64-598 SS2]EIW80363.1 hypothetical protein CONPUDRAFT_165898 [Coniophora puteana RWD-64-598 SS2]
MHHALELPELVDAILTFLDQTSIAALARSCRALHESASDALYYEIWNVTDLFGGLDSSLWAKDGDENVLSLARPFQPEDHDALRRFTSRVRVLHVAIPRPRYSRFSGMVHHSVLDAASSHCSTALFPSLKCLHFNSGALRANIIGCLPGMALRYFLGPTLFEVDFQGQLPGTAIQLLSEHCPALRCLSLPYSLPSQADGTEAELSLAFSSLQALNSICVEAYPENLPEWLPAIARSPCLRTLTLNLGGVQHAELQGVPRVVFPTLESLELQAEISSDSHRLLQTGPCDFSSVTRLDVKGMLAKPDDFTKLVEVVSRTLNPKRTTRIAITDMFVPLRRGAGDRLRTPPVEDIRPLMTFGGLTELVLSTHLVPTLDDQKLEEVALAFPCIRIFHYSWRPRRDDDTPSMITLKGLSMLCAKCKQLESLQLLVDARVDQNPPAHEIRTKAVPAIHAWALFLDSSRIDDVAYTAACLRMLFPRLVRLEGRSIGDGNETPFSAMKDILFGGTPKAAV